ncbi:hypothetical protein EJ110_NYTH02119 [Nymphaea thermarum]|nr:hypothetical protein EJ110_NYTH02119 [Nymphaea thermarum]
MEGSRGLVLENPFSFKVGQVFTGFGVGCGIGIGVGRPINLGGIPMVGQVMSATRGATDAVSGVGVHVNSALRRLGIKNIDAGVGCGVGIGHGFGVGIALKPGVINQIQSRFEQMIAKMMKSAGGIPGFSAGQNLASQALQSNMGYLGGQTRSGNVLQMVSGAAENVEQSSVGHTVNLSKASLGGHISKVVSNYHDNSPFQDETGNLSKASLGGNTSRVISNYQDNSLFQDEKELPLNELASKLQSENNAFQVLLKHQRLIEELTEENEKLRQVLIQELNISPEKFQGSKNRAVELHTTCNNCFECRRRRRRSSR